MNYLNLLPEELHKLYYENLKQSGELIEKKKPYDVKWYDEDEYPNSKTYFSLYNSKRIKRLKEFFKTNPTPETMTDKQDDEMQILDTLFFNTVTILSLHDNHKINRRTKSYNRLLDFYVKWLIMEEKYKSRKVKK